MQGTRKPGSRGPGFLVVRYSVSPNPRGGSRPERVNRSATGPTAGISPLDVRCRRWRTPPAPAPRPRLRGPPLRAGRRSPLPLGRLPRGRAPPLRQSERVVPHILKLRFVHLHGHDPFFRCRARSCTRRHHGRCARCFSRGCCRGLVKGGSRSICGRGKVPYHGRVVPSLKGLTVMQRPSGPTGEHSRLPRSWIATGSARRI